MKVLRILILKYIDECLFHGWTATESYLQYACGKIICWVPEKTSGIPLYSGHVVYGNFLVHNRGHCQFMTFCDNNNDKNIASVDFIHVKTFVKNKTLEKLLRFHADYIPH